MIHQVILFIWVFKFLYIFKVIELCENGPISQITSEGKFKKCEPEKIREYLRQIILGVEYRKKIFNPKFMQMELFIEVY